MELLVVIFIFMCLIPSGLSRRSLQTSSFNVVDNRAVGDGMTDDSQAFIKTWKAVCATKGGRPTLKIPAGKTFFLNSVELEGPCKSNNIHVSLKGNIVAPKSSAWTGQKKYWIRFSKVNGLTIDGNGKIEGQGDSWWSCVSAVQGCDRPRALDFLGCNNLTINGISSLNTPKNHISIDNCKDVTISNVHLTAPEDSPNTDGIDIAQSTNVQIKNSFIGTGDDCVAINSGSSFINITNVTCGPGHGISVGSLGEYGEAAAVEEIHVSNCNFTGTKNGIRIKTFPDASGYARKISFDQITFVAVKNPIIIDQHYCPHSNCDGQESKIQLSDITYTGVHGSSINSMAINFNCSGSVPCTNILTSNISIWTMDGTPTTSACVNVHGTEKSTTPAVSCLTS